MTLKPIALALALTLLVPIAGQAQLALNAEDAKPLAAGSPVPDVTLATPEGIGKKLGELIAGKPTVLIFFRGGWCPFCSRQLAMLGEHELEFRTLGYQVIGVTAESPAKVATMAKENHSRYRLFADPAARSSIGFGVAFRINGETAQAYRGNGIELAPASDGDGSWLVVPTAFIIDRQGVVRFVYSNPDPAVRISPEDLLAAAKRAAGN